MHAAGVAVVADAETEVDAAGPVAEVEQDVPQRQRVLAAGDRDEHALPVPHHRVRVDGATHLFVTVMDEAVAAERCAMARDVDDGRPTAGFALHCRPPLSCAPPLMTGRISMTSSSASVTSPVTRLSPRMTSTDSRFRPSSLTRSATRSGPGISTSRLGLWRCTCTRTGYVRRVVDESVLTLGQVHLVGVDVDTATKLLYTAVFVAGLVLLRWLARIVVRLVLRGREHTRGRFWSRQGINLATSVIVALGLISIWFDNGLHAAAAVGVLTAALAFAMQKAVTSFAGYFLILRGDIFSIGDRVVMGGVRGDVIGLGFLRTTILEMGQPTGDDDDEVPVWVDGRQYTGRVVTVTNSAVFDDPVFNYSREFTFLWEELRVPVKFDTDLERAEQILLDAALEHSKDRAVLGAESLQRMRRRFYVPDTDLEPEVYFKFNSNWVELAVRFIVPTHGIRRIKSAISRQIIERSRAEGIEFASTTFALVEVPPLKLEGQEPAAYPDEVPPVRARLPENER